MIFYELIEFSGKSPTLWAYVDDKSALLEVCEYLLGSAREGSLKDFIILAVERNGARVCDLYEFCEKEGILPDG